MAKIPTQFKFANKYITPLVLVMMGLAFTGINNWYPMEILQAMATWLLIIGPLWFVIAWFMKKRYRG